MPIRSIQTIQSLQSTYASDRKVTPQHELCAAGTSSDRFLEPRGQRASASGGHATAWRVFEEVVYNTFAQAAPASAVGSDGLDRKQVDVRRAGYQNRAAELARRITQDLRQLQHGWDRPLTIRHVEIVGELERAAKQQSGIASLAARATAMWDAPRSAVIAGISKHDIHSLHGECLKHKANPKQELRGNSAQRGDALKLKHDLERGFGLGRTAHRRDAWDKFRQVLCNTFMPRDIIRWQDLLPSNSDMAARRSRFDQACVQASALVNAILRDLRGSDPAAPLRVEQVAQVHQFFSSGAYPKTPEGWDSFQGERLNAEMFLTRE